MPFWDVSEPYVNVRIEDTPLGYDPARGPAIDFTISYRQRGTIALLEDAAIFGVGTNWSCSFRAFLTDLQDGSGTFRLHRGGAGWVDYTNGVPQYNEGSILTTTSGGYQIEYPSGAKDAFTNEFISGTNKFYFLTSQADPAGNAITYTYSNTATGIRLLSVADADGNTNHLYYENQTFTNLITKVVDPFSRTNILQYDNADYLTNSIDVEGLTNSFAYDPSNPGWIIAMTTPYGTTLFTYGGVDENNTTFYADGGFVNQFVTVTLPTGGHHLYLYRNDCTNVISATYSPLPSTSPLPNTLDNVDQAARNSFYWGPLQYVHLSTTDPNSLVAADYAIGRLRHWLLDPNGNPPYEVSSTLSLERAPSPDTNGTPGEITWYDYDGKTFGNNFAGTNGLPSLVAVTLPDGTSTRYTHYARNPHGLVTKEISTYSQSNGSIGQRTNTFYYGTNNIDLLQWVGPNGEQVVSNYFAVGNTFHEPNASYDALNQATLFTYNSYGQATQILHPTGLTTVNTYASAGTGLNRVTNTADLEIKRTNSFTYYANGLVNTHIDERGLTTTSSWDNLQRLTSLAYPDGTTILNVYTNLDLAATKDRLGHWTYFGYNALRQKIAETNANGVVTTYEYCDCGALFAITNAWNTPVQTVATFAYDLQGNRTYTYLPDVTLINWFDPLGQVTNTFDGTANRRYSYNNQGLLTNASNTYGTEHAVTFDIEDRPFWVTDANGVTVTNAYDLLSRLISRKHADGGAETFGYSARGLTAYTNQIGATNFFASDEAGRRNFETNANHELVQLYYDSSGSLTNLIDGKGQPNQWAYDAYGRITNKLDQTGIRILAYAYDPGDRLTNRWSPTGGNTYYTYDPVGNLTNIAYADLLGSPVALQYDPLNRLTRMVDGVGTTVYTYTAGGELFTEDGPFASDTVTNGYANRLRTSLALQQPTGAWTNGFIYDAAARLTNVTSQAGSFGYAFDAQRSTLITRISLPNSAYITNRYDPLARLTGTFLKNSGNSTLDSATYGYNPASQRTTFTNAAGTYVQYSYDNISQLKVANSSAATEDRGYAYDTAWNLNFLTNNGSLGTFLVDTKNELTNALGTTIMYDDNGNLRTINNQYSYGYDVENRLVQWISAQLGLSMLTNGDLVSTFAYDGLGRLRVRQEYTLVCNSQAGPVQQAGSFPAPPPGCNWDLTSEVHYIYDGLRVIQERDTNNAPQVSYTRGTDLSGSLGGAGGIGGLLARSSGYGGGNVWSSQAYYHADGGGNITAMLDGSQAVVASYRYDPYGNTISSSGTLASANVYRFSGKEIHVNSGMYYFLYRFYDPGLQRWLNRDPLGEIGGINLYSFAANNPACWIDPDGLDPLGHHFVPRSIWNKLSDRIKKIWDNPKNRLDAKGYKQHNGKPYGPNGGPKVKCKDYAKAVEDKLSKYLEDTGAESPEELTNEQLQEFANEIRNTTEGEIGAYNAGVAEEIAAAEVAASEGAAAAEVAEVLAIAVEVDEAVVVVGAIVK